MPRLIVITRAGDEHTVEAAPNISMMEALRDRGVGDIAALCGGCCSCATCHVYIDPAHVARLPPRSDDELVLLESSKHFKANSRLSCQIRIVDAIDGLKLEVAPEE